MDTLRFEARYLLATLRDDSQARHAALTLLGSVASVLAALDVMTAPDAPELAAELRRAWLNAAA